MRILAVIAVSLLAAASAVAQVAEPAPTTPVETSALPVIKPEALRLEPYAAGLFKGVMETRRIPGAVFVAVKNGEVLFAKGYGYANVEAGTSIDPETTQFRVASVSKLITATAVMQLVEAGRLKLDADVNDVLQAFKIPRRSANPSRSPIFSRIRAASTISSRADRRRLTPPMWRSGIISRT